MRKNYLSKVIVAVRAMATEAYGVEVNPETHTEELVGFACALGFVSGKRGREGGYLVTDAGLSFIGEDPAKVRAQETAASTAKTENLKAARKTAAKERKAQLASEIKLASQAA